MTDDQSKLAPATQVREARIAFLDAYWPDWREDEHTQRCIDLKAAFNAGFAAVPALSAP